jgi:HAD superfamily hydrolase (TIGR01509 family)
MEITNIKGYILDLDGTLIDSMPLWYDVDRIFLTENGVTPPENVSEIVKKMTVEESSQYFIDTFNIKLSVKEISDRIEEIVAENYRDTIPLKEGIIELLDYLDSMGIPYGVATATYRSLATVCLKRLGILDRLKFLETCSEIGKGKESPEIFFKCAETLGFSPENIAVVEDSLYCLKTAKVHGFYTIGMYDSSNYIEWDDIQQLCDVTFKSAKELLDSFVGNWL